MDRRSVSRGHPSRLPRVRLHWWGKQTTGAPHVLRVNEAGCEVLQESIVELGGKSQNTSSDDCIMKMRGDGCGVRPYFADPRQNLH